MHSARRLARSQSKVINFDVSQWLDFTPRSVLHITADDYSELIPLIWICGVFTLLPLCVITLVSAIVALLLLRTTTPSSQIPTAEEMSEVRAQNDRLKGNHASTSVGDSEDVTRIWAKVTEDVKSKVLQASSSSSAPSSPSSSDKMLGSSSVVIQ